MAEDKNAKSDLPVKDDTTGRFFSSSLIPGHAGFGPPLVVSGVGALFVLLLMTYFPDGILPFDKHSLLGYACIFSIFLVLVFVLPGVLFSVRWRIPDRDLWGRYPGIGALLICLLSGVPFAPILRAVQNIALRAVLLRDIHPPRPAFYYETTDTSLPSQILIVLVTIALPIVIEEFFFRGFLFSLFPHGFPGAGKILLTALAAALFSLDAANFVFLFAASVFYGYVRHTTGSLLGPILARIGAAASGALFTNILPPLDWMHISGSSDLDPTVPYGAVAALVICIIAFLPIIAELRATRKESLMHGVVEEPSKDEPFTIAIRGMSFPIALLLLAACWVLLLGV